MIGIINYGMGNLASVSNAFEFLGYKCEIFDSPSKIKKFSHLVLPGVGAFGKAMQNLKKVGFNEAIKEAVVERQTPLLGICLGMQLLMQKSYEYGVHEGLSLFRGEVKPFAEKITGLPVPHIGWNELYITNPESGLISNTDEPQNYYFVHSFYCEAEEEEKIFGKTIYGLEFTAMIENKNIFGCQFHPEKSQKFGLKLLEKFALI